MKGKTLINKIVAAIVVGSFLTVTMACYLVGEGGATLAEAEYAADGTVTVLDRDCQVVQRWTSDQLRLIVQGHGAILDESEAPTRMM